MSSTEFSLQDLDARIREFDRFALPALQQWLQEHPEPPDPFYQAKLGKSMISALQQRQLLYLLNQVPVTESIVEIGTGMGQVPLFLAVQGYHAFGLELAQGRVEGMRHLIRELDKHWSGLAGRCDVLLERFPKTRPQADVLLFCNTINGHMQRNLDQAVNALRDYSRIVLDLRTFDRKRDADDEQEELRRLIVGQGLDVTTVARAIGFHIVDVRPGQ